MELIAFSVEGYRRFAEKTSVKLVGKLIAFVGPNEAGKSSLLAAIASLHDSKPFQVGDCPRRSGLVPSLAWHFKLEAEDKAALEAVFDGEMIERLVVTRRWESDDSWAFLPQNPSRDRSHRLPLATRLKASAMLLREYAVDDALLGAATEVLGRDTRNFGTDEIELISALEAFCKDASSSAVAARDAAPEDSEEREERAREVIELDSLADEAGRAAVQEKSTSPFMQAVQILKERLPRFCLFADEDRDLKSEYDIDEVAADPPPALQHLLSLAGLDLETIQKAANEGRTADISTYRNAANRRLEKVFAESWNQTGVAVQLEVNGPSLLIQATTPADDGLSTFAERSDGMRWFAALLAYAHGWSGPTVLLADEIETHLHYDAQADLLNVLQNQTFAAKVLYSTHSFGCLPPDLGAGVRVVRPVDTGRSRLENGFWAEGSGFSPLLARMGAAALSFTPARRAVVAEGPADAVLLPSLLRQAANIERLGYQVVPGLSSVAAAGIPSLEEEAGRVFFLTDSDDGGAELRRLLNERGVQPACVFELDPGGVRAGGSSRSKRVHIGRQFGD